MRQPPSRVELIALGHMRTVGTNSNKNQGRATLAYPQNVVLDPPLLRFVSKNTAYEAQ